MADVFYPEEHGPEDNRIPAGLDFSDLGLESLPTVRDECWNDGDEDTEEWSGNPELNENVTPLGGSDVSARWCTCVENGCNGAEEVKMSAALVMSAVGVVVAMLGA